jgi:Sulfotransferase domain
MPLQASALVRSTTRGGELIGRHLPLPKALKQSAKEALIALAFARADGAIASYPKSGRTWLRFILANYFDLVFDLGLAIDLHSMFRVIPNDQLDEVRGRRAFRFERRAGMPFLLASHAPYRRTLFAGKTILLMLREPKDLMVSAYFHRAREGGGDAGGIKAFLRDPAHGLADYIRYSNRWAERLGAHRHLITSYERLAADTEGVAQAVLELFEVSVDARALGAAIERSRFDRMRALEIANGLPGQRHDRGETEGLRVRKGKIGGFRDYLDADDVAFVDQACRTGLSAGAQRLLAAVGLALA